ncbi:MAG: fumarylacetoacetate hydrolase family protein [Rhizobiaceae bacterium]
MKLLRVGPAGQERPAIMDGNGAIRDLSSVIPDINGETLSEASLARLRQLDLSQLPQIDNTMRVGPCVASVGKFMCIGLNYSDHAAEAGMAVPQHPILFMKANSAICGPNDDIEMPRGSTATDWEVELGVVIGKKAKYVTAAQALEHVAGYCLVNDVSERHYQIGLSGQWTKGKSCDTFGPIGPYLVTRDEVGNPQDLDLELKVNGNTMQKGSTRTMIFPVAQLIEHLSSLFTLHPGDIISTGTPPGVGMGMKPPVYLKAGDRIEAMIAGFGVQKQLVVQG